MGVRSWERLEEGQEKRSERHPMYFFFFFLPSFPGQIFTSPLGTAHPSYRRHPLQTFIIQSDYQIKQIQNYNCLYPHPMNNMNQSQNNPYNPYQSVNNPVMQQLVKTFVPIDYRTKVQDDVRLSFAGDLNPLIFRDHQWHIRSLIATIILLLGILIPLCIWIWIPEDFTIEMALTVGITGYMLYLLIGSISNELNEYLSNIQQGQHFQEEYYRVRGLAGQFDFQAQCYHYETRYHMRHYNRNGRSGTQTYSTQQKVVTHRANQSIVPAHTEDISGNVDRIRSDKKIVFIHFIVNYKFSNDYSRNKVDELFYAFKSANTRDMSQNFTNNYNIPNLIQKMTFYVGDLGCNYNCWYYFFNLIGLLWPYSLWVESKISRFDVAFMKLVTM